MNIKWMNEWNEMKWTIECMNKWMKEWILNFFVEEGSSIFGLLRISNEKFQLYNPNTDFNICTKPMSSFIFHKCNKSS